MDSSPRTGPGTFAKGTKRTIRSEENTSRVRRLGHLWSVDSCRCRPSTRASGGRSERHTLFRFSTVAHSCHSPQCRSECRLVVSRLRGRAVRRASSELQTETGRFRFWAPVAAGRYIRIGMLSDLRCGIPLRLVAEIKGCSDNERTPCKRHPPQDFMENRHTQNRAHQRFQIHENSRLRCWNPLQSPIP